MRESICRISAWLIAWILVSYTPFDLSYSGIHSNLIFFGVIGEACYARSNLTLGKCTFLQTLECRSEWYELGVLGMLLADIGFKLADLPLREL